jgi:hypothetical protein
MARARPLALAPGEGAPGERTLRLLSSNEACSIDGSPPAASAPRSSGVRGRGRLADVGGLGLGERLEHPLSRTAVCSARAGDVESGSADAADGRRPVAGCASQRAPRPLSPLGVPGVLGLRDSTGMRDGGSASGNSYSRRRVRTALSAAATNGIATNSLADGLCSGSICSSFATR